MATQRQSQSNVILRDRGRKIARYVVLTMLMTRGQIANPAPRRAVRLICDESLLFVVRKWDE